MKINAIIYTSNTGYTQQYAVLLINGGSCVNEKNLDAVLEWYNNAL